MSTTTFTILIWTVALACAAMSGVYFTFSSFVMGSLQALPSDEGAAAMQSINREILRSAFMPVFFGSTLAALGLAAWGWASWGSPETPWLIAGGLLYVIGMFVWTALFNVPLNDALDAVDAKSLEGAKLWSDYLVTWTRHNSFRAAASMAAAMAFLWAAALR